MHWKDTLIKSEEIKWKRPPIKNIKDGKMDILITLPLTSLFEIQAKRAFAEGMLNMLRFHIDLSERKKAIEVADLVKLLNDTGLPEYAEALAKEERNKE